MKEITALGSREFLLKDWEAAHRSRDSYASMRLGVVGACITILGLVFSVGKDAEYPATAGIWLVLLGVVFAGVRMLATANRTVYIFGLHMAAIESELGEIGFAACWEQHVKTHLHDTATKAFLVAARLMNSGVSLLVVGFAAAGMSEVDAQGRILLAGFAVASVVLLLWNEIHMRRELDPRVFLPQLEETLRSTREALIASRQRQQPVLVETKPPNPPAQADGSAAA